jgi:PAS domain S-box-containing protein
MSHEEPQHHSFCTLPQDRPATEVEALKARVRELEALQDATERSRAQEAQRNALSHLDRAQRVAKLGHWEWELGANRLSPSQTMADIFGVSMDELRVSDADYLSFVHPMDRERTKETFGNADEVGGTYETEYRIIRPDGEERVLFEIGEPEFDATGKPIGMFGTVQDITERHRAQKAQHKILTHLDRAQKVAKMGYWEWELGSKRLRPSQGMADILGRSMDELHVSDEAYLSFVHPSDRKQTETAIGAADVLDEAYETEYRITRPDGQERVIFEIGEPAFDAAGKPIGMFGIVQDITERKQVEIELHSAQQRADAANEAKSAFLANMSHEIRTPLNGILGMAQVLSSNPLSNQQSEQVGAILDSGKSLLAIVNDVLDLSKIEAGHMEIAPGEGDLAHVMKGMLRLWTPLASEKGLELIVDIDETVPHLSRFDPLRVRQCISNLLSNAIKFTEVGYVRVHVTAKTIENDCHLVTIRVADTGVGMSKDVLENVFVPFAQAEKSTSRVFGGTGLGLSISRKLAQLLGGDLVVQSNFGEGSVFLLTFRLDPVQHDVDERINRARDTGTDVQVSVDCAQLKVLIVDDRALNLMVARLFLEPYRIKVTEAGGGQAALDLLASNPFDLVLLDIHMPVIDGPETFRRIRASGEPWSDIPVIALTADAMSGDRENYLAHGMNGYVSKPIDQMDLIGEINRVSGLMPSKSPKSLPETELGDAELEPHNEAGSGDSVPKADIADLLEQMDQAASE